MNVVTIGNNFFTDNYDCKKNERVSTCVLLNIKRREREERDSRMRKQARRKTVMNVTDRGMRFFRRIRKLLLS